MNSNEQAITIRPKFKKYLEDIGITEPIQKRIDELHSYVQRIIPSTITDIFITDYVKDDESHVYSDIDFYTETGTIVTVENFLRTNEIRIGNIKKNIVLLEFIAQNYDFRKANGKSRLLVKCWYFFSDIYGYLKATGRNCDYAMEICRKYYLPNIRD